jgi:hypothetical protein
MPPQFDDPFTTDGSWPGETNVRSTAPIRITNTIVTRGRVSSGFLPTGVDTHTYLSGQRDWRPGQSAGIAAN